VKRIFFLLRRNKITYDKIIVYYKEPIEDGWEGEVLDKIIYNGKEYIVNEENIASDWSISEKPLDIMIE